MSIVAVIAVAMTFVACGNNEAQDKEEAIPGTDFTLVTTAAGEIGVKKGDSFIIQPRADYESLEAVGGMFLVKTAASGQALVDPETGYEKISSVDTIIWKDGYFEAQRAGNYIVYDPTYKYQFAGQKYVLKGNKAIALFNGKMSAWRDGKQIIEPNNEYKKLIMLPDGTFLALDNVWGTATATADRLLQPGKAVPKKAFKKYI